MKKIRVENFFTVLILIFGAFLILITPIGAGQDEETHFARIWEMSKGNLIANQSLSEGPNLPHAFYQLAYHSDVNLTPVTWDAWKEQLKVKIDWDNMYDYTIRTRYFPTFYLPQAFIMGILGRVLDTPIAIIYYVERFSYLFIYALLIYFTIRITPVGKWIFGVLAIAPMAMIQISTITADGLNNAIAFLFIAWILYMNRSEKQAVFSRKEWFTTALLTFAVCTLKMNGLPLLLLLFLIPRKRFGSRRWFVAFIFFALFSFVVVGMGWNIYNSGFLLFSEQAGSSNTSEQLKGIITNPLHYLGALAYSILSQMPKYLREWIGISAHRWWLLPAPVYWLTPVVIVYAFFTDGLGDVLNRKKRIFALVTFLALFIGTWTIFYLLYNDPGTLLIRNIHGRYFLFIGPLLLISLLPHKGLLKLNRLWLQIGSILIAGMTIAGLFLAYHITCGSSFYTPGLCMLPKYKNWSIETSLSANISASTTVRQTFTPMCDDVSEIWIWINKKGISQDPLSVNIMEDISSNLILSRQVPQSEVPSSGWLVIDFPTISNLANKNLILQVDAGTGQGNSAIELGYSPTNEYIDGLLTIDNQPQVGDLMFKYGCVSGLEKIFH